MCFNGKQDSSKASLVLNHQYKTEQW